MLLQIFIASLVLFAINVSLNRHSRGLNKFNGPLLASFSNLWRLWYALSSSQKQLYVDIHREYGDIVRLGPNELSFADPQAIHGIYGPNGASQKSDAYRVAAVPVNGVLTEVLFSGTNISWHDRQRRLINSAFSLSQLIKYELWVDETIDVFIAKLRKTFASKGSLGYVMNMMEWFAYFSLDVITDITFGERSGFLETGTDVGGTISQNRKMMESWLYLPRMPILDQLTLKNPILLWLNRRGWFNRLPPKIGGIAYGQFTKRQQYYQENKGRSAQQETLTDNSLRAQDEHPDVREFQPFMHGMSVWYSAPRSDCFCGAITLSSIFYFLLKNPRCYRTLQQEVDNLDFELGSRSTIPFAVAKDLPYPEAVVNEAMRCHNISRLPTSRLTPPSGMAICGKWIPGGVEFGVYASVLHHRKEVFGEDVDLFRPERWLGDEEKVRRMRNTLFSFSSGKYSCLGKYLSRLELLKVIPELIRTFEIRLANPEEEWKLENGAFAAPTNLNVRLEVRSGKALD